MLKLKKKLNSWQYTRNFKPQQEEQTIETNIQCDICQLICKSNGGLAIHKIQKHNIYPLLAQYIATIWCP